MAAGPRASVNGTSCPWSSGLEPGSRSQYGQRWPELPRPPGHRCPSAHPAGRSTLGSWVSPEPPQGRCRTRGAGRGGAEVGAGVWPSHVGGRRLDPLLLPPPPPPQLRFPSGLGCLTARWRPASATLKPEDNAPAAAASRLSHDRPVPFGCARPPQVPPTRVLTLTVGRAGSSAPAVPCAPAQRSRPHPYDAPGTLPPRDPQGLLPCGIPGAGTCGPPRPPPLPREGIHSPLSGTASAAVSETGHRPCPRGM